MSDLAMPATPGSIPPERRLAAVGLIHQRGGRTTRILATAYGATGSIRPAGACPTCKGRGGHVEDTSNAGATRKTWRTCDTCRGTGGAR